MAVARQLVARRFSGGSTVSLRSWRGDFYEYQDGYWRIQDEAAIRAVAYRLSERAFYRDHLGQLREWRPTRTKIANLLDALRVVVRLSESVEPPAWVDHIGPDPRDLVVTSNGILHLPTRQLLAHDARLFTLLGLPFAFDPLAKPPNGWHSFLDDLWGDDPQSLALAQEIAGYAVSADRSIQKAVLVVGPTRAGKGVFAGVIAELVGRPNVAAPTLSGLTTNFGLQDLIGRTLAVIADARLASKANLADLAERLLSISGQDLIRIDRKFQVPWTGRLATLVLILTNELPRFSDASQALAKRFLILVVRRSFYGREDRTLLARLTTELSGIFNWALDGYDRLRAQGHFTEPISAREIMRELEDLSSPVTAFLRDVCVVDRSARVAIDELWDAWKSWCDSQGQYRGTRQTFGRDLRAAVSGLHTTQPRDGSQRRRDYVGIGLLADNAGERVPRVPESTPSSSGTDGTRTGLLSRDVFPESTDGYRPTSASTFGPGPFDPDEDERFREYNARRLLEIEQPARLWSDVPDPRNDSAIERGHAGPLDVEGDYPTSAYDGIGDTTTGDEQ
jgi:putative DNA primase/helicase